MIFIFQKYQIFYFFNILIQYNNNFKENYSINMYIKYFFLLIKVKLNNVRAILKFSLDTFLTKDQFYRFY